MKRILLLVASCLLCGNMLAQPLRQKIQSIVDSFYVAYPGATGIIIHVEAPDQELSVDLVAGVGDKKTNAKLLPGQPVQTASNTKTYIAATVLKLVEQKKIALEDTIADLLSKRTNDLLVSDGYKTNKITVKQLLSQTAGISDFVDEDYTKFVDTHKDHHWTRDEQILRAVTIGKPFAEPGDSFKYADINYLLLTEIIEHCTGKSFYTSVRDLLQYRKLGLDHTWFADLEPVPAGTQPRAHQYWETKQWDSYDFDLSWDLYGGGGIIATARDMAVFYQRLFDGSIIKDTALLRAMHTNVPSLSGARYCLGVWKISIDGREAYYHGGFLGTDVAYFPGLNASVAIVVLEKNERDISAEMCKRIAGALGSGRK